MPYYNLEQNLNNSKDQLQYNNIINHDDNQRKKLLQCNQYQDSFEQNVTGITSDSDQDQYFQKFLYPQDWQLSDIGIMTKNDLEKGFTENPYIKYFNNNDVNIDALDNINHLLSDQNKKILDDTESKLNIETNRNNQEISSVIQEVETSKSVLKDKIVETHEASNNNVIIQSYNEKLKQKSINQVNNTNLNKIDSQILSQHLPKAKKLYAINIEKANNDFTQNLKYLKQTKTPIVLDKKQKQILGALNPKLFPKTFDPEIHDFIIKTFELPKNITGYDTKLQKSINIFIPDCFRIQPKDNIFLKIYKLFELINLPIHYIVSSKEYVIYNNIVYGRTQEKSTISKKYLFGCTYPIENTDQLGIFVFLKSDIFDQDFKINQNLQNNLASLPMNFMFFKEFYRYNDLLFPGYEFVAHTEDNKMMKLYQDYLEPSFKLKLQEYNSQKDQEKCIIQEFNQLKDMIKTKIFKIQDLYFRNKNIYIMPKELALDKEISLEHSCQAEKLINRKRKIYQNVEKNKPAKRRKVHHDEYYAQKSNFIRHISNIHNKISNKYQEEKLNKYSIYDLYVAKDFNESIFNAYAESIKLNKIRRNIKTDMKKNKLDIYNNLMRTQNVACVLIHKKYYINPELYQSVLKEKSQALANTIVQRYYTATMHRSHQKKIKLNTNDNKIVVTLTTKIPDIHENTENKVFVFLPTGFDLEGKPLLDPNSLSIYCYFYSDLQDKTIDVGYPLYVFYINSEMNSLDSDVDDTKYNYLYNYPNIELKLVDYMQEAYQIFHNRVLSRMRQIQKRYKRTAQNKAKQSLQHNHTGNNS